MLNYMYKDLNDFTRILKIKFSFYECHLMSYIIANSVCACLCHEHRCSISGFAIQKASVPIQVCRFQQIDIRKKMTLQLQLSSSVSFSSQQTADS